MKTKILQDYKNMVIRKDLKVEANKLHEHKNIIIRKILNAKERSVMKTLLETKKHIMKGGATKLPWQLIDMKLWKW